MAIKVNMRELAEKLVDECPIVIKADETLFLQNNLDEAIIADYVSSRTTMGCIITELDYELLRVQLVVFIKHEIFKRIKKQMRTFDKEDLEIFSKLEHEYEEEKDGY